MSCDDVAKAYDVIAAAIMGDKKWSEIDVFDLRLLCALRERIAQYTT